MRRDRQLPYQRRLRLLSVPLSGLRVAFIGAFAASILAHPSPSNAETVVWVRDNAAIELVEARELVDSVSVMRLDSATFQLCTGCISSAYTFVPVELLAGHESGGATLGGQC